MKKVVVILAFVLVIPAAGFSFVCHPSGPVHCTTVVAPASIYAEPVAPVRLCEPLLPPLEYAKIP